PRLVRRLRHLDRRIGRGAWLLRRAYERDRPGDQAEAEKGKAERSPRHPHSHGALFNDASTCAATGNVYNVVHESNRRNSGGMASNLRHCTAFTSPGVGLTAGGHGGRSVRDRPPPPVEVFRGEWRNRPHGGSRACGAGEEHHPDAQRSTLEQLALRRATIADHVRPASEKEEGGRGGGRSTEDRVRGLPHQLFRVILQYPGGSLSDRCTSAYRRSASPEDSTTC